jgi:hypothetical protein
MTDFDSDMAWAELRMSCLTLAHEHMKHGGTLGKGHVVDVAKEMYAFVHDGRVGKTPSSGGKLVAQVPPTARMSVPPPPSVASAGGHTSI